MKKTIDKLDGKRILIWGMGREGKSTLAFLEQYCPHARVQTYEGARDGVRDTEYDWIFVSPGIPFEEADPRFTSQTEVFLEEYRDQTVGITGTKGKSTTSSMLAHVLKQSGKDAILMGNIGLPCFDYMPRMAEDTIAVFELSCHQCQRLLTSPRTAVFLNLYQDHLDRYITRQHYFEAKLGITRNQGAGDVLYLGEDVPELTTNAKKVLLRKTDAPDYELFVRGRHNRINAYFVERIAVDEFGASPEKVRAALASFTGLPHRLQFVGRHGGIDFYDDSISTIPEASIQALGSVENASAVIIGGMDRGIDYSPLVSFIGAHPEYTYVLCYASGERIRRELEAAGVRTEGGNVVLVTDLDEALQEAVSRTAPGRAVILSPAAASYGYFRDFEARGDYFQSLLPALDGGNRDDSAI